MPGSTRKLHRIAPASLTHVDVMLGSLTATSEEFAYSLVAKVEQQGATVTFQSLDNFNPDHLVGPSSPYRSPSRVLVFVLSTHMAGKPASTAEAFLLWLQQSPHSICSLQGTVRESEVEPSIEACASTAISQPSSSPRKHRITSVPTTAAELQAQPPTRPASKPSMVVKWRYPFGGSDNSLNRGDGPLSGVQYTVFGVGNSIYRTFNATAKYVDTRLYELGALKVFPLGLGDASKWIDVTFMKWEKQLLQLVSAPSNSSTTSSTSNGSRTLDAGQEITLGPTPADILTGHQCAKKPSFSRSRSFTNMIRRRRSALEPSTPVVMPPLKQ